MVKQAAHLSCLDGNAKPPNLEEMARDVLVLDDVHDLVRVNCAGGAYNTAAVYYVVRGGDTASARQAEFGLVDAKTGELRTTIENRVVNGEFIPASGEITFFAKARGMGDCGVYGSYGWTGSRFALLSQQEISLCDGVDSSAWPTYWRTQTTEREGRKP